MRLNPEQEIFEIFVRIDAVQATRRDDALQDGEVLRAFDVACE